MGKVIIGFTTSLDGFINDQNGSVERQSVRRFGFRNRRGNNPGTIRIPFYLFSILCVPRYSP
jgi:hypothetical protein